MVISYTRKRLFECFVWYTMPQGHNNITIDGHESIQVHVLLVFITLYAMYITDNVGDMKLKFTISFHSNPHWVAL